MHFGVAAGTRLTVVAGDRRARVRTLEPLDVGVPADIAVLASACAPDLPAGHVHLTTDRGRVTVSARVLRQSPALVLRLGSVLRRDQRRDAVRGDVRLDVLIAVPDGPGSHRRVLRGRTLNVSAGGVLVELPCGVEGVRAAGLLDAELTLGEDEHVPAVLGVVGVEARGVRATFVDLDLGARRELGRLARAQRAAGRGAPDHRPHPVRSRLARVVPLARRDGDPLT